jgi:hypothetical protein
MINTLVNDAGIPLSPLARKSLRKMVDDQKHPLNLDKMDQFIHNRYAIPTPKEVRAIWAVLEPLLENILIEPLPTAAKAASSK